MYMLIQNYDGGMPTKCMNRICDNKCTQVKIVRIKNQDVCFYFCDEHYKQLIEEVYNGNDY